MARKVNSVLWDQWRQRLTRQRASGLPIAAFCRKEGVAQAAFYAWRRKLRISTPAQPSSGADGGGRRPRKQRAALARRRRPHYAATSLAEPGHAADFLQLPVRPARSSPWIELSLVDGTLVRIPQENLVALTTLLKVLRGEGRTALAGEARHA